MDNFVFYHHEINYMVLEKTLSITEFTPSHTTYALIRSNHVHLPYTNAKLKPQHVRHTETPLNHRAKKNTSQHFSKLHQYETCVHQSSKPSTAQ